MHWRAPLSASAASGPQFQLAIGQARWDLWFEASGAAHYYGLRSLSGRHSRCPRQPTQHWCRHSATKPTHRVLTLECKWSPFGNYVGRNGYHQAAAYAVEARSGLAVTAWSYVVGPEEVVLARSEVAPAWDAGHTVLGSCSIQHVDHLVELTGPRLSVQLL